MKKKTNIYLRKSDGTYYYDKTINGNRFYKFGFKNQKAAEEALINDLFFFCNSNFKNVSINELVLKYKNFSKDTYSVNTIYNRFCLINKYILPFFKGYTLQDVNSTVLQVWKTQFLLKNGFLSVIQKNKVINCCKNFFKYADSLYSYNSGYISLTIIKAKKKRSKFQTWNENQFNSFIKCIDDYNYLVMFHLMFYYGIRLGEALGLKFENVDFDNFEIHIVNQLIINSFSHKSVDSEPKTSTSIRSFFIDDFTCNLLKNLYEDGKVYVFEKNHKPFARTSVRRYFYKIIEKSGVSKILIHSLRRSCSTRLYKNIKDIKAVGTLLGHSEETMTFHYLQTKKENDLKLIQEVENSIKKDNEIYINLHFKK